MGRRLNSSTIGWVLVIGLPLLSLEVDLLTLSHLTFSRLFSSPWSPCLSLLSLFGTRIGP